MSTPSNVVDRAAAVRRLVTPRVRGFALPPGAAGLALERALEICRHLQPDQHEAAIIAHRHFVRLVRADLATLGTADQEYLAIANALVDYLYGEGFAWRDGRWSREASPPPAPGPQLVDAR
jgi:hypothetical protein